MKRIDIGGKEYIIEYDINAGCDMEERAGKTIDRLIDTGLSSARLMLWGGLKKHHDGITLAQAGDILAAHGDRAEMLNICFEEMKQAGFFGKAVKEPPTASKK